MKNHNAQHVWKKFGLAKKTLSKVPKAVISCDVEDFIRANPDKFIVIGPPDGRTALSSSHEATTEVETESMQGSSIHPD